jgi:hypothetical protein
LGYNTSFMLLNDTVHTLDDDPNVGRVLHELTVDLTSPEPHRRHRYGYRGIKAIHSSHADHDQIVRVGWNRGELIGVGVTLNPLLEAAVALAKSKDPSERRRLIRVIESNARIHDECRPRSDFSL